MAQRRGEIECEQAEATGEFQRREVVGEQAHDAVGKGHAAVPVDAATARLGRQRRRVVGVGVGVLMQNLGQLLLPIRLIGRHQAYCGPHGGVNGALAETGL